MTELKGIDIKKMAEEFHKVYEDESKQVGWKTHKSCQVKFDDVPIANKTVMLRTCMRLLEWINKHQEEI